MLLIVVELVSWGLDRNRSRQRLLSFPLKRLRNQAKLLKIRMVALPKSIMGW